LLGFLLFFVEGDFYSKNSKNWHRHGIMAFDSQCDIMYNFSEIMFNVTY